MTIIDAHVHVWTDNFADYPLAPGFTAAEMKPGTFTPTEALAHCRPAGVERIVLVQMSYYGTDNSYMLATMAQFPGVFGGIAVIDENAPEVAGEMSRLGALGVRGFRIMPQEASFDTPGYHRMFRQAAQSRQSLCCLLDTDALPSLDRMCAAYPEAPVVIDHLGRIGINGCIAEADVAALCSLAAHPQVQVKVSAFYALGQKRPPHQDLLPLIRRVYEAFGARALMWGSDCPYQVQDETYEDGLALVRDKFEFSSQEDREWVLGRTAEQAFF